jgi:6-phosphogluconolactonase
MNIEVLPDAGAVARRAAAFIAATARSAASDRGRFVFAVSGGRTPWVMLRALVQEDVPWEAVEIVQVDERAAPEGHPDRNLTHLRETLLEHAPLKPGQIHAMPVDADDLAAAARGYAETLHQLTGPSGRLDLVHLGLGPDGHTASLVPGAPALEVRDVPVAVTGVYQGRRRMTLTFPVLDNARQILWVVTGDDKREMLLRLRDGDAAIPAGRVASHAAVVMADRAAAALLASVS